MPKRRKPQGKSLFKPEDDKSRQNRQAPVTEGDSDAGLTVE